MIEKKFEVVLFQPYIRKFVLNFGQQLKQFTFCNIANTSITGGGYHVLPNFENELLRIKTHWKNQLRRLLGIPNIRPYFKKKGDLLFTYGCLLLTHKPYCTYIETGLALYNYDLGIAKNPIAKWLIIFLATRKNCKKLIFVSEASKKSFFSSVNYPKKISGILERKSTVIYPIPLEKPESISKKRFEGGLKLLFPGTFYMKGGMEVVRSYEKLRRKHGNVSLTVITAVHMLKKEDVEYIRTLPDLILQDANLNGEQMADMYRSHDILLLPTYREGFGLVLIEALSYGMPLVITDQYATTEMAIEGYNGFIYPNHPLKDYDSETYEMLGKYYNPKDFYSDLFKFQHSNQLKPVEEFLMSSIEKFLQNKSLLEKYSMNSLALYNEKFHQGKLSEKIEGVFLEALGVKN